VDAYYGGVSELQRHVYSTKKLKREKFLSDLRQKLEMHVFTCKIIALAVTEQI